MSDNLVSWLIKELEERGWSHRELARRAGLSQTTVSQVISQQRKPTWDFCAVVAKALGEPVDRVFVLAGLKRPLPPPVEEEHEALGILRGLSASVRGTAMTMLRALAREEGVPAGVGESQSLYVIEDDAHLRELVEEFQKVPDEWKDVVIDEVRRVQRFSSLPPMRLIGEDDIEEERDQPAA
jgi:transcriptional regulator with XRE-family HTH domain